MNPSAPFIQRPVATTLLTLAIAFLGILAMYHLPVSPLPQIEFPTIQVSASLPGASPETMASSVATPLERQFGRIAGITEMSSSSTLGSTSVTMQFDLNRDVDGAARDVESAINAARSSLPANLPSNPSYRKVNPADSPILIMSMTSDLYNRAQLYEAASSVLQQKLSQIRGVGTVTIGGGALPAVRVELNPAYLNNYGLGLEDVRRVLSNANANSPKGILENEENSWIIQTTDQLWNAEDFGNLLVAGGARGNIRLRDVARVTEATEELRAIGFHNNKPCIVLLINRQPGANIIGTVDRILAELPNLAASIPQGMDLLPVLDRTTTIRASMEDIEFTLMLSIALVVIVVFLFLGNARTALIPSIAIPVSLIGTYGIMYLLDYSLNNLSLMALTIATGFVVDDAIVVTENITRHIEQGANAREAALKGAKEIGFTVLSISLSLTAVFIPLLMMEGIIGRLFREFSITLTAAVLISMVISLTTTPMLCSVLLKPSGVPQHGAQNRWLAQLASIESAYETALRWVLRHQPFMLAITLLTIIATGYLYTVVPKGFFPQQDTGRLMGQAMADQSASFQSMVARIKDYLRIIETDPAVDTVVAFAGSSGGNPGNQARLFASLKPLGERRASSDEIIGRLRGKLAAVPGASMFLQSPQDLRIGGRMSASQWQYTVRGTSLDELQQWGPRLQEALRNLPALADVNMDQQNGGLSATLDINRENAMRLGISTQAIDDTLYDAFGQRQVSTMYNPLNQNHVVMNVAPELWESPDTLKNIYIGAAGGKQIPLSEIAGFVPEHTPLNVNHSDQFPSVTISFNLNPAFSLGEAIEQIEQAQRDIGVPTGIQGRFQGAAQAFLGSLQSQTLLILAAIFAVYIVLGILYESYLHPVTILSTIPSAGVGALLALMLFHIELNVIGMIGIILLIGIVKKNAIMMIDFALHLERNEGMTAEQSIFRACVLRFRPIMMTTLAALLGAVPLAFGRGTGYELRQPLGISIIGGLILSQMITLFSTPVIYLYMERLKQTVPALRRAFRAKKPDYSV
ncbi:MMPL family transporter [Candidatus Methylospira mobilis]|uniref:MMPL family transporter n=1 Tax=Candidatus Methylospira mobilis TaxID=1808979 RepID=A0A5Q0BF29_9GAMM|nr:efflux RND transporter permease subunit [Candidatus Methylospira mobilis]QFY41732.1 MMPL family transporter [Candidatus Methylospira mobilis]